MNKHIQPIIRNRLYNLNVHHEKLFRTRLERSVSRLGKLYKVERPFYKKDCLGGKTRIPGICFYHWALIINNNVGITQYGLEIGGSFNRRNIMLISIFDMNEIELEIGDIIGGHVDTEQGTHFLSYEIKDIDRPGQQKVYYRSIIDPITFSKEKRNNNGEWQI